MGYFFSRIHETVRKHQKQLLLWCELDNIRMPAEEFFVPLPERLHFINLAHGTHTESN